MSDRQLFQNNGFNGCFQAVGKEAGAANREEVDSTWRELRISKSRGSHKPGYSVVFHAVSYRKKIMATEVDVYVL